MSRCRMGNPKKQSRFICLRCLKQNHIGDGIQRFGRQRPIEHEKDLYCLNCKIVTQNMEVRYCDDYEETLEKAIKKHMKTYGMNMVYAGMLLQ